MTVRRAINILVSQGMVTAIQGRGTFVKPLHLWKFSFDLSELQKILNDEKRSRVEVLQSSLVLADERIARKMKIKPGDKAIYTHRMISVDEKPSLYHREYLVCNGSLAAAKAGQDAETIRSFFEEKGRQGIRSSQLTIEATVLDAEEARLLDSTPAKPAFLIEYTFYDFQGRIVSWGWFVCPGDKLKFTSTTGLNTREEEQS